MKTITQAYFDVIPTCRLQNDFKRKRKPRQDENTNSSDRRRCCMFASQLRFRVTMLGPRTNGSTGLRVQAQEPISSRVEGKMRVEGMRGTKQMHISME